MKVSVVIPTYNRASVLLRAMESVLKQSFVDFELIIVNDGSVDNTEEILQPFLSDERIRTLKQANTGVSSARNLGILASNNEWIAFLDSDDEWLPQKLQTQIEFLKQNPTFRFIHSEENWIRNGVQVNIPKKFDKSHHQLFERSLHTCLISPSTVLIKKEILKEHDHFDPSFEICEDYDLWLKILIQEPIGYINEPLINKYGGHDDQLSTKHHSMDLWRIRSLVNLYLKNKKSHGDKIKEVIDQKTLLLKKNLLKHNQIETHQKLVKMLELLK